MPAPAFLQGMQHMPAAGRPQAVGAAAVACADAWGVPALYAFYRYASEKAF